MFLSICPAQCFRQIIDCQGVEAAAVITRQDIEIIETEAIFCSLLWRDEVDQRRRNIGGIRAAYAVGRHFCGGQLRHDVELQQVGDFLAIGAGIYDDRPISLPAMLLKKIRHTGDGIFRAVIEINVSASSSSKCNFD